MEFLTFLLLQFSSVQWLSHAPLFATPWTATHQASLSMNNSRSLPTLMSIESVMLYNHLNLCCFHRFPPSIFPNIRVFSNESGHHIRWPNIGVSSSTSVLPMNIQEWFLSGWTDWISLQSKGLSRVFTNITVQKHRFFNTQLFIVQLSHPYMAIEKTIALTRWTFVGKVMSLHFNMLSRLVITFLPRRKHLLISWLQSLSSVILEPEKIRSATVSPISPSICHEAMGPDAIILVFWCWALSQLFHSPLSLSSRGSLVLLHFLP